MTFFHAKLRNADQGVERDPCAGDILCDDGRGGGAENPQIKPCDKPEIQYDIEHSGNREKEKRCDGVAQRAQKRGKKVIEKGRRDPAENHDEIFAHQAPYLIRHLKEGEDGVGQQKDKNI